MNWLQHFYTELEIIWIVYLTNFVDNEDIDDKEKKSNSIEAHHHLFDSEYSRVTDFEYVQNRDLYCVFQHLENESLE